MATFDHLGITVEDDNGIRLEIMHNPHS